MEDFLSKAWRSFTQGAVPNSSPTLQDLQDLINTINNEHGDKRVAALKSVYELCGVNQKENRVPMVTNQAHDVLTPLAECLEAEESACQFALLALNNLSIPPENKTPLALGPASRDIIGGLTKIIALNKENSYLACICLMNISMSTDESVPTTILQFIPDDDHHDMCPSIDGVHRDCITNPNSLLRILERLLMMQGHPNTEQQSSDETENPLLAPLLVAPLRTQSTPAAQEKALCWACGLIRYLAKSNENATIIGQTNIPKCLVRILSRTMSASNHSSMSDTCWIPNTLPVFCLQSVLELQKCTIANEALMQADDNHVLQSIMTESDLEVVLQQQQRQQSSVSQTRISEEHRIV